MDPSSRIAMLAAPRAAAATGWAEVAYTLGAASGLSSLYGMALGARGGGPSLALHAAFAPVAVVGAFVVGALPLYVLLAIADAPVELPSLARAIGRGAAAAGLLLGGLAPLVLLFGVSGETWVAGAVLGWSSLVSSLLVGLAAIRRDVAAAAPARSLALAGFVFAAFSATLALRVAWVALPALGRGGAS